LFAKLIGSDLKLTNRGLTDDMAQSLKLDLFQLKILSEGAIYQKLFNIMITFSVFIKLVNFISFTSYSTDWLVSTELECWLQNLKVHSSILSKVWDFYECLILGPAAIDHWQMNQLVFVSNKATPNHKLIKHSSHSPLNHTLVKIPSNFGHSKI
jgi:hypothetical protein